MKVYITKYALTQGIMEKEAEDIGGGVIKVARDDNYCFTTYYPKGEWFTNLTDANLHAKAMRKKKIESLNKQLSKLEKMKFMGDANAE